METFVRKVKHEFDIGKKIMILVFGKTGQVGSELKKYQEVIAFDRSECNFCFPEQCVQLINNYKPYAVINAVAYTDVDKAEEDIELAFQINGSTPLVIAHSCKALNIPLVHISTDYVFDGSKPGSWKPNDATEPVNTYGKSKLYGEQAIIQSGATFAILRTSWVISSYGSNFIKKILSLSKSHQSLKIVADQMGGPTPAKDIADACISIAKQLRSNPKISGVYHLSGKPDVTWFELTKTIFNYIDLELDINPISSSEYVTLAKRPLNSCLDCSTTNEILKIARPDWREGLKKILIELKVL